MVITEKIKEEAEKARRRLLRPRGWRAEPPSTPIIDRYLQQQQPKQREQHQHHHQQQQELPPPILDQLYPYR